MSQPVPQDARSFPLVEGDGGGRLFSPEELCAAYLVETPAVASVAAILDQAAVSGVALATTAADGVLACVGANIAVAELHAAWARAAESPRRPPP